MQIKCNTENKYIRLKSSKKSCTATPLSEHYNYKAIRIRSDTRAQPRFTIMTIGVTRVRVLTPQV